MSELVLFALDKRMFIIVRGLHIMTNGSNGETLASAV